MTTVFAVVFCLAESTTPTLFLECKIFTDEETIYGADSRGEHFRWCSPQAEPLDKELHAGIVQQN